MKWLMAATILSIGLFSGCAASVHGGPAASTAVSGSGRPIAEGIIYGASFNRADGDKGSEGFTRVNDMGAIPGGHGQWNVDAYGQLFHDYLIITYPRQPDLGPKLIPASRILEIQFGDGGIKQVSETRFTR